MSNISADKLAEKVNSRYSLVVLAAKRAKQLKEGAPKLIETNSTNTITIALEEIAAGKVGYDVPNNDIIAPKEQEPELLAIDTLLLPEADETAEEPAEPGQGDEVALSEQVTAEAEPAAEETEEIGGPATVGAGELDVEDMAEAESPLPEAEAEDMESDSE